MVSIVIPAYNCEDTIEQCLESVLNQTYEDIEVIVIDDGSKDNTYSLIEKIARKDNRVKYKKIPNSGPGGARNTGIDMATGQYLAFVDADDTVYPNYIEAMMVYMDKHDADMVLCNMEWITEEPETGVEQDKEMRSNQDKEIIVYENKQAILEDIYSIMCNSWHMNALYSKIYKLEYIQKHNVRINEELDMGEDFQFNIKCMDYVEKIVIIPDELYRYLTLNSQLTYKYRPNLYEVRKIAIDEFNNFVEKYNLDKNIIHYLYVKLVFADCMQMWNHKDKHSRKDRKRRIKELINRVEIIDARQNMKPAGLLQNVLYITIKTNNITIIDTVAKILVFVKKIKPDIKRASI